MVLQELNAAATSTEAFGSTAKAPVCNSLLDERTRACTKRKIDDVVDPDSPSFKTKVQVHQGETRESLESGHLPVARSFYLEVNRTVFCSTSQLLAPTWTLVHSPCGCNRAKETLQF